MDSKLKEILKEEKRRRREAEGRREGKDGRDRNKQDSEESPEGRRKDKGKEKGNRSERRDKEKDERAARHEREKKEKEQRLRHEKEERERKEREEYRLRKEKEREAKAKEKKEELEKERMSSVRPLQKEKEEASISLEEQKEKEDPHANLGIDENTFMFVFEDKKGELYNNINKITKDDKDEIKIFPVYFKGCDENLTEETVVYDLIANKIVPLPENSETSWLNTLNDPKNKIISVPIGDIIVYNGKLFHCLYDLYDYLEFYGAEVLPLK